MKQLPVMRPSLGEEEARAVAEVVASGWIAQGPKVAEFERLFAARVGAGHGVALSSCTAGLHLAMVALGIGPGDEVVVPSLSFIATANAVRYVGARPVFADVDRETGNLTGKTVSEVLSPRTAAVILVHQGGMPADVDDLRVVCEPLGVPVVEDAACAAGSVYRGRPVGTGARLAAWSFHPRKLLTTGEGGMLTLDGEDEARRLRRLREHGMNVSAADRHARGGSTLESYVEVGYNYRMTDLQAALGIVQVGRLDALVADRRRMATRYWELLSGSEISPVRDPAHGESNFQSFWVRLPADSALDRGGVLEALAARGISARRGIMAAHLEPAYAGVPHVDLPVTEELTRETVILPLFQGMTEDDQVRVVDALRRAVEGQADSR
jgi:dTDP-4-amino-4,6-dideoxygalactose transaminase